ncbi:unnamed protein product [Prorocentrum cordatum]|uniref:Uncharacterized protein n=1 Tax=Prorocentrum cordatum TaxID=2364126 RepID=A0ABN9UJT3_9DINO|nr:unnamed protein product [Polarella glacialis]
MQSHYTWNVCVLGRLLQKSPSSCVALWYPLLDQETIASLHNQGQNLAAGSVLVAELWLGSSQRGDVGREPAPCRPCAARRGDAWAGRGATGHGLRLLRLGAIFGWTGPFGGLASS